MPWMESLEQRELLAVSLLNDINVQDSYPAVIHTNLTDLHSESMQAVNGRLVFGDDSTHGVDPMVLDQVLAAMIQSIPNQTANPGQTVAFTASVTEVNSSQAIYYSQVTVMSFSKPAKPRASSPFRLG